MTMILELYSHIYHKHKIELYILPRDFQELPQPYARRCAGVVPGGGGGTAAAHRHWRRRRPWRLRAQPVLLQDVHTEGGQAAPGGLV